MFQSPCTRKSNKEGMRYCSDKFHSQRPVRTRERKRNSNARKTQKQAMDRLSKPVGRVDGDVYHKNTQKLT